RAPARARSRAPGRRCGGHGSRFAVSSFARPMEGARTPQPAAVSSVLRPVSACVLSWEAEHPSRRIPPRMAPARVSEEPIVPAEEATPAADVQSAAVADPDVALMLRVQAGDHTAFQELFRKLSPRILQYARRFVGSEAR